MRIKLILMALSLWALQAVAQPTGYYNGTEGLKGDALKTALNGVIDDHREFSYFAAKTIMKYSDADPATPGNVIAVYTGRSQNANDYGSTGDQLNREHVWAKSHGNFNEVPPMFNDVHNLKPADASVNTLRSNKDFDNGGTEVEEAPGCFTTSDTWEPRDAVKGDIARIIFYMATRYEGNNGERDLTVVDRINTYPLPEHGKLSTLLQWNELDPPDDFERNRNNVIFQWQTNRNPFIDHPEFVNLIWGDASVPAIYCEEISMLPIQPMANDEVTINATIAGPSAFTSVQLVWGTSYDSLTNTVAMEHSAKGVYTGKIPGQEGQTNVYYQVTATDGTNTGLSIIYNYYVAPIFSGTITSIYDIQGQTEVSPYEGQEVSTTGIVTASFGANFFLQSAAGAWNGLFVYDANHMPSIGDSIIVTGIIEEYYGKTELKEITAYYLISSNNTVPEPTLINTGDGGEAYESVLVKVGNAICTDAEYQANYYMWKVNDGSGDMLVHNTSIFEYEPVEGTSYDVIGPLNWDFGEWKIELRLETDVQDGSDIFAPEVVALEAVYDTVVKVTFSEPVTPESAEDALNYQVDNGVNVIEAKMHSFLQEVVFLTVTKMENGNYTLLVDNISDLAGNTMEMTEVNFTWEGTAINDLLLGGSFEMYPNPAAEKVNLYFTTLKQVQMGVRIIDLTGRTVFASEYSLNRGGHLLPIQSNMLQKGLYLVKLTFDGAELTEKLIIQ